MNVSSRVSEKVELSSYISELSHSGLKQVVKLKILKHERTSRFGAAEEARQALSRKAKTAHDCEKDCLNESTKSCVGVR